MELAAQGRKRRLLESLAAALRDGAAGQPGTVVLAAARLGGSEIDLPAPVALDATVPSPDPAAPSCAIEYECYEGMLVAIADGVTGSNPRSSSGDRGIVCGIDGGPCVGGWSEAGGKGCVRAEASCGAFL